MDILWTMEGQVTHTNLFLLYKKSLVRFWYPFLELWADKTDYLMGDNIKHKYPFVVLQTISWDLWCKMDFSAYPIDKQVYNKNAYIL